MEMVSSGGDTFGSNTSEHPKMGALGGGANV